MANAAFKMRAPMMMTEMPSWRPGGSDIFHDSGEASDPEVEHKASEVTAVPSQSKHTTRRRVSWFLTNAPEASDGMHRASIAYRCVTTMLVLSLLGWDEPMMEAPEHANYRRAQFLALIVFVAEYILRVYSCPDDDEQTAVPETRWRCPRRIAVRLKHMIAPIMLLEFVSILALVGDICSANLRRFRGFIAMRLFRLLTVLKVDRKFHLLGCVLDVIWQKRLELYSTVVLALLMLVLASACMFMLEGSSNKDMFPDQSAALWWAVTALTTVGYGDLVPKSGPGRLLGGIVAFIGVGLFALPAGIIATGFQEAFNRTRMIDGHRCMDPGVEHRFDVLQNHFSTRLDALENAVKESMAKLEAKQVARLTTLEEDLRRALHLLEQVSHQREQEHQVPQPRVDHHVPRRAPVWPPPRPAPDADDS